MFIGIQSNVWSKAHHQELMPQMLEEIALAGYDGIEIGAHRFQDLSQPQKFSELVQSRGLHVSGIHMLEKYLFADALQGKLDYPQQVAAFTQAVDSKYLLYSGDHRADKTDPYTENLVKVLNLVGQICQAQGITLCYHNHWWEIENEQAILKAIRDHTDPALVSICVDLAWVQRAGDSPPQVVSEYLDRVKYLHLKDTLDDQWADVGYGAVDFESVFQITKAMGRDDIYSTVERDEVLPDALESARRSMARIREMGL
jgi:sugar phosphate isomerase/epimerase